MAKRRIPAQKRTARQEVKRRKGFLNPPNDNAEFRIRLALPLRQRLQQLRVDELLTMDEIQALMHEMGYPVPIATLKRFTLGYGVPYVTTIRTVQDFFGALDHAKRLDQQRRRAAAKGKDKGKGAGNDEQAVRGAR